MLLKSDFHSETWKRFKKHTLARIDELREQNDKLSLSPERTAAIRGSIAELKRLLDLEDEQSSSSFTTTTPDFVGDGYSTEDHA